MTERVAAGPMFAARSMARTENVWRPSAIPEKLCGEEHGWKLPPGSSRHSAVARGSSSEKAKLAMGERVRPAGPPEIEAFGAVALHG